jgi:HYR domain-containing protein
MRIGWHSSRIRTHFPDGVPHRRCLTDLLLIAALSLALAPAHADQTNQQQLFFLTSNQGMWAEGPQYVSSYSQLWGATWDASDSGGGFTDGFGAKAKVSTSGAIGLRPHLYVNGGAVSVSYPVQITVQYPDAGTLYPGDPFTISTSFAPLGGGILSTSSPHAQVTLDAILSFNVSASAEVEAFGSDLFNDDVKGLPQIGPYDVEVLDTDSTAFQDSLAAGAGLASFITSMKTNGVLSGGYQPLSINTSGGLVAGADALESSADDPFFYVKIDYSNAALSAAGLPGFETVFDPNLGSNAKLTADFQILDAYELINFDVAQHFRFHPHPHVHLLLSDGQTLDLRVGDSATLTFPTVSGSATSNDLTFSPTYRLESQLHNRTDLVIEPSYNFTPLNVTWDAKYDDGTTKVDLGHFSVNPVGTLSADPINFPITLYDEDVPLGGFGRTPGSPFTLAGYVYPLPTVTSVTPAAFKPGAATQFTVAGTNFVDSHTNAVTSLPSSTAQWNGQSQTSQYSSPNLLTFNLSPADANTEGIFPVTVANPAPGGGASNAQNVIIDGTPPVTTPGLSGPQNANNNGWYKGAVTVNLTTTDSYSGVHDTGYQVDGGTLQQFLTGAPLGPGSFNTPAFTVSGEGKHSVSYQSDDNVGNAESQKTQEIDIDGTPPALTFGAPSPAPNAAGWNKTNVSIPFTASDNLSGVAVASPSSPLILTTEGAGISGTVTVTDVAGNSATFSSPAVNVDKTPPATTASLAGTAGANGWYKGPVTVALSAADALSGVAATTYSVDAGAQTAYSGPFSVSGDGQHTVSFYSTDTAGNSETPQSIAVNIDSTPPTLTFGTPAPNAAGWNNTNVSIPFTASDATSGVASTNPSSSPLVLSTEGSSVSGTVTVTDAAGNTASFTSPAVKIDKTPPTTTASATGQAGANGWYIGNVSVTLAATDALSGVARTTYSVDGGAPVTYSSPFTIKGDGRHTVQFASTDVAGNGETARSLAVNIDTTKATLTFGAPTPAPNTAGWNNTPVSIPFTAADATSGVFSITPSPSSTTPSPSPLVLSTEGKAVTGKVAVTDVAGNLAKFTSPAVNIDLTAPTIKCPANITTTHLSGKNYATVNPGQATATDSLSGVASIVGVRSDGNQLTASYPIGTTTITWAATDLAGNASSCTQTITVN